MSTSRNSRQSRRIRVSTTSSRADAMRPASPAPCGPAWDTPRPVLSGILDAAAPVPGTARPAAMVEERMPSAMPALPVGTGNAPSVRTAAAPASAPEGGPAYAAGMFNPHYPASARLPLLAAHIAEAFGQGMASTCQIYNFLRDVRHWTHLPGSVEFRRATAEAGWVAYAWPRMGSKRTVAVPGNALHSIARCAQQ